MALPAVVIGSDSATGAGENRNGNGHGNGHDNGDSGSRVDLERDRRLVVRWQAGDDSAFDELYRRYSERLFAYCLRRVGNHHAAEELTQEAFARALRAMPRFAGERRFYPWLTVIAHRLCIDHHRRMARVEPAPHIDTGAVEDDHDAVFAAVDHESLASAIDRIAPRHREVLKLREQEGYSYQQIAEHLNVPLTTVEALLHRARKALRREFLAVSGGGRLASLPIIGWLALGLTRLRSRVGSRAAELAQALGPAAAGIGVVAIAVVPFVPSEMGPVLTPPSGVTTTTVAPSAASDAPALPAPEPAPPPPTTPSTSPPSPDAPEPAAQVANADVFVGEDGYDHAREHADEMPIGTDMFGVHVGTDPSQLVTNVVDDLAGGTK